MRGEGDPLTGLGRAKPVPKEIGIQPVVHLENDIHRTERAIFPCVEAGDGAYVDAGWVVGVVAASHDLVVRQVRRGHAVKDIK